MDNLIQIIVHNGSRAVNARELHAFLGVGKDFSSWIKERISKYGFVENQDFSSFTEIGEREVGATVRKEYALSLDMAKELSMVENNERGRQARKHFIECEKKDDKPWILERGDTEWNNQAPQFKVITAKGKEYGENQVSPKNQSETQPRWYDDKFQELLNLVGE